MISNRSQRTRRITTWGIAAIAAILLPHVARADSVTLHWTAPGDDGNVGRASSYELRVSTQPIANADTASWWSGASPVGTLPPPQTAGSSESYTVSGLVTGTTYYFVIRTADEVPNWSGFSNVAQKIPGASGGTLATVTGLTATTTSTGVSLSWQEPSSGAGSGYHLYRRTGTGGSDQLLWTGGVAQTAYSDTTVSGGETYEYRVVTYQGASEGPPAIATVNVPVSLPTVATTAIRGYPNPAHGRVTLRFNGSAKDGSPGHVRITIFDMAGHKICQLLDGTVPAGEQSIEWRCHSDNGNPVAPGLYTAILDGPQGRSTMRLAIVP